MKKKIEKKQYLGQLPIGQNIKILIFGLENGNPGRINLMSVCKLIGHDASKRYSYVKELTSTHDFTYNSDTPLNTIIIDKRNNQAYSLDYPT